MSENTFLESLVNNNLLTKETMTEVLNFQLSNKLPLNEILINENFIKEVDLIKFYAQEENKPFIDLITDGMIDSILLAKVPFKFLRQNNIILVQHQGKNIVLMSWPKQINLLSDLKLVFSEKLEYGFAPKEIISDAINKYYPFNAGQEAIDELTEDEDDFDLDEIKEQDIVEMANDAPIVKLVNHIIFQAVKEGVSDIHIEPYEKELRIRFRVDGVMHQTMSPPKRYHGAIISRIKIISDLNIAEKRIPQDGRINIRVADKSIDLRVSILPCNFGERVVMRILDKSKSVTELNNLSFSERDYSTVLKAIERPNGIILVSGPTGSGKTTTLYSVLYHLNDDDTNIITVEDPIEYTIQGVNQVQVNVKTGLTFASALRSILRQDPDIALIGEIRDGETAKIATQAALTGHLVLSTIHTNSAPATISRIVDMGIEPFMIASSLVCVIAQRLVRKLCQKCKVELNPEKEFLEKFGLTELPKDSKLYKAGSCKECLNSGYKGRMPLFEVMEISDQIASMIVKKEDVLEIKKAAVAEGMTTLASDGVAKALKGMTTLEEVMSVAFIDEPIPDENDQLQS